MIIAVMNIRGLSNFPNNEHRLTFKSVGGGRKPI